LHTHNLEFETKGENWKWKNSINFAQHLDTKDRWRMTAKSSGLTDRKNRKRSFDGFDITRRGYNNE
jgi:hypothetical protein